jgi:hypothetical protein
MDLWGSSDVDIRGIILSMAWPFYRESGDGTKTIQHEISPRLD